MRDMNSQKALSVLLLLAFTSACKYEPVSENTQAQSSNNSTSPAGNSQNANTTAPLPPIEVAKCDGECTCDEFSSPYNDTGVTFAGDYPETNLASCDLQSGFNQDCSNGRDSMTDLPKTGTGNASFDYTKLDTQGQPLSVNAAQWQCVRDNVTGLVWEVKSPGNTGGIQDSSFSYSWYDESLPDYSTADNGECDDNCDSQSYLNKLNTQKVCGFDDWRLPNKIELQDLVHYGNSQPSIDRDFFPNTQVGFYWTQNIDTDDTNSVWSVGFGTGRVAGGLSSEPKYIRAVRGEQNLYGIGEVVSEAEKLITNRQVFAGNQRCSERVSFSAPSTRYLQDEQGNVFDKQTGLIWKRCVAGLSGSECKDGSAEQLDWQQAYEYVAKLNDANTGSKWRLPSIKELQANNELACEEPALNPFVFPNVPMGQVWSGTPHNKFEDSSYNYEYRNSIIFYNNRTVKHYVHAVKNCAANSQ
ncbi:hypothetical protein CWC21_01695 [Pseudoalteromonas phenolica]|nr:hypothetical protein CWC21_01695 [Pseudoalteromonas phenolica]